MVTRLFSATHVLAYEKDGKMVEELVRLDGASLYTESEWLAHAVSDWTFEDDGRLYYCGIDYAEEGGACTLRPTGKSRLPLDTVLLCVQHGQRSVLDIARVLGRAPEEVATAIATLQRLGKVARPSDDRVVPVFEVPDDEDLDG